jgi:hypothetical protein
VTDVQRMLLAVVLFLAGAAVTATGLVVVGAVLMVAGLAALLWGRSVGDNRRPKP